MEIAKNGSLKSFRIYVLPGIILQSVMIGGGYGTGREIFHYFSRFGAVGGLWGLILAGCLLFLVVCLTFEFARVMRAFDYGTWSRSLLGKAWPLYDILYFFMATLVVAVLTSAAASILEERLGIPFLVSAIMVAVLVAVLMFYGRRTIENYKTVITAFLYITFITVFIVVITHFGGEISTTLAAGVIEPGWARNAGLYVMFNLVCLIPVLWFCDVFETRRQVIIASIIAAFLALMPATLTFIAMIPFYQAVAGIPVPWVYILDLVASPILLVFYFTALALTLAETSTGMVIGFTQRIEQHLVNLQKPALTPLQRAIGSFGMLMIAVVLAQVGVIALIAKGYHIMGYGFLVLHALPLITIGVYKIMQKSSVNTTPTSSKS